jgi:hypothetical protein
MLKHLICKMLLCSFAAFAVQPFWSQCSTAAPSSTLPQTVTIMGRTLSLIEHKGGMRGQGAQAAYISANESPANWTLMFAVGYSPGNLDPKDAASATVQKITSRKASGQDPLASASVFTSKSSDAVNVVFVDSTSKPKMLEHNVFRYFRTQGGTSSYQITRRIFGTPTNKAQVADFMRNIPAMRSMIFEEIGRSDLPHWPN